MFPLSHMMRSFIQKGRLEVIDVDGGRHVFAGAGEGAARRHAADRCVLALDTGVEGPMTG